MHRRRYRLICIRLPKLEHSVPGRVGGSPATASPTRPTPPVHDHRPHRRSTPPTPGLPPTRSRKRKRRSASRAVTTAPWGVPPHSRSLALIRHWHRSDGAPPSRHLVGPPTCRPRGPMRRSSQRATWLIKRNRRNESRDEYKMKSLQAYTEAVHAETVSRRTSDDSSTNTLEEPTSPRCSSSVCTGACDCGYCCICLSTQLDEEEAFSLKLRDENLRLTTRVAALEAELTALTLLPPSLLGHCALRTTDYPSLSSTTNHPRWLTSEREDEVDNRARQLESWRRPDSPGEDCTIPWSELSSTFGRPFRPFGLRLEKSSPSGASSELSRTSVRPASAPPCGSGLDEKEHAWSSDGSNHGLFTHEP
jgi:hypothetical protein